MGHNDHVINLYGVLMILIGNLLAGGLSDRGTLSPNIPAIKLIAAFHTLSSVILDLI